MSGDNASKGVFCVRNHVVKAPEEHLSCPYCFGKRRETVEGGQRSEFCDFNPEKDPISFGFPQDTSRVLKG